ncbi:hypothetical protein, partial [Bacillus safensis]|uniref:hypothetical protein n=1 Tax=Bacillus safensis TaxID=561879 RepID=UPI002E20B595|nr:hypothetical protein [Bacillus safensis]
SLDPDDLEIKTGDSVYRMITDNGFEIIGATNHFVNIYGDIIEIPLDNDNDVVVSMSLEADRIIAKELLMIAKKFNIDLRAVATHLKWEFTQHVLIINGNVVKDETINICNLIIDEKAISHS